LEVTTAPEKFSETCRNHRLRLGRREAWWEARRLTDFARVRMDWHSSLQCAQAWNVPGSSEYPKYDEGEGRFDLVHAWRAALMKQMLTPAPDVGAVNWKRVQFRGGQHRFTTVKPERLQRAIDADVELLNAHPSRKSIAASRQARKGD
jgi:hypothetical protein